MLKKDSSRMLSNALDLFWLFTEEFQRGTNRSVRSVEFFEMAETYGNWIEYDSSVIQSWSTCTPRCRRHTLGRLGQDMLDMSRFAQLWGNMYLNQDSFDFWQLVSYFHILSLFLFLLRLAINTLHHLGSWDGIWWLLRPGHGSNASTKLTALGVVLKLKVA